MGQIFSDDAGKKCDKCIQMHYIGKSYETTVYKCDDEKMTVPWDKYFPMKHQKSVTSVYKCIT